MKDMWGSNRMVPIKYGPKAETTRWTSIQVGSLVGKHVVEDLIFDLRDPISG